MNGREVVKSLSLREGHNRVTVMSDYLTRKNHKSTKIASVQLQKKKTYLRVINYMAIIEIKKGMRPVTWLNRLLIMIIIIKGVC